MKTTTTVQGKCPKCGTTLRLKTVKEETNSTPEGKKVMDTFDKIFAGLDDLIRGKR